MRPSTAEVREEGRFSETEEKCARLGINWSTKRPITPWRKRSEKRPMTRDRLLRFWSTGGRGGNDEHAPTIGRRAAVSIALQDKEAEATWATELQHDAEGIPRTIEGSAYRHVLRPMSDFQKRTNIKEGLQYHFHCIFGRVAVCRITSSDVDYPARGSRREGHT